MPLLRTLLALVGALIVARVASARGTLNLQGIFALVFFACIFRKRAAKPALPDDNSARWRYAAALLLATVAAFLPALHHYFLGDDFPLLSTARMPLRFRTLYDFQRPVFFRPLVFVAYRWEWLWAGDKSWKWHLAAIFLHVAICWMVYSLGKQLYRRPEIGFWAAAFFAWHGLHTEVVAWNASLFELLATLLGLGALLLFLRDLEKPRGGVSGVALACEAASLLAKESAYCLPLLVSLLVLGRSPRRWARAIPFWLTAFVMFAIRWYVLGGLGGYTAHFSPIHAAEALGLRIWALLWFPVNGTVAAGWCLRAALAAAVGAAVLLTWTQARRRDLLLALGFALLASLPALSQLLVGADLAGSRCLYLPSIGFALLLAVALQGMPAKNARVAAGAALLLFHLAAVERNLAVWGEVASLAERTCRIAAAQIDTRIADDARSITVAGVHHYIHGVQFFSLGLPECIAMHEKARVTMAAEGTPGATLIWDAASLTLIRQSPSLSPPGRRRRRRQHQDRKPKLQWNPGSDDSGQRPPMGTTMKRYALLFCVSLAPLAAATLIVSPSGDLRSLAAARDAIRALRQKGQTGPMLVQIRAGTYRLEETFVLTPEDSEVTYMAYPREHPIISGGRPIEGWKKTKSAIWTAPAPFYFRQLFINGRRALRARTPTNGFYRIDGPSSQDKPFLLKFRGNDIQKSWAGRGDVEAVALLAWAEVRMPIAAVDEAAHIARLTGNPRPSNKEKDARYWIENAPDGLDSPGEWYLDRHANTVSYWPVAGEDMTKDKAIAPLLTELVRLEGHPEKGEFVRNVVFRGLDFRHADWTIGASGYADSQAAIEAPSAFDAIGAENVTIDHCRFTQSGGYAVWFGRGSRGDRVVATEIFDMGAGGVKIGETAMRANAEEQSFENTVTDSDIHDLGLVYPPAAGIWVGQSSRNYIGHNHVHDLYYTAISVGWTWGYKPNQCQGNIIEYNHLHHIGRDMLSDMGAIYTLGEQPGTVIRNNLIHDISSFTYGGWGIYPDEGSSEILIENNIVYRTKSAGFHQHYGRENIVHNNIFAFGREYQLMRTRAEQHLSFTFEGNIIYYESGKLLGGNWSGNQYDMRHNLYWDARGEPVTPSPQDSEAVVADPLFANPGNYDFTLNPKSPAFKLGWTAIDMTTVGPRAAAGPER